MDTKTKIIIAITLVVVIIIAIAAIVVYMSNNNVMSETDILALYDTVYTNNPDNDSAGNYYMMNYGSKLFISSNIDTVLSSDSSQATKLYLTEVDTGIYNISYDFAALTVLTAMGVGKPIQLLENTQSDSQKWKLYFLLEPSVGYNSYMRLRVFVPLSNLLSTLSVRNNILVQSNFTNNNSDKWLASGSISDLVIY
jgi:hypothetical protein